MIKINHSATRMVKRMEKIKADYKRNLEKFRLTFSRPNRDLVLLHM